jgi:hypothetical protein
MICFYQNNSDIRIVIEIRKNPVANLTGINTQAFSCICCSLQKSFRISAAINQLCLLFKIEQAGLILSSIQKQSVKHSGVSNKKWWLCLKVTTTDLVVGWKRYGLATENVSSKGMLRKMNDLIGKGLESITDNSPTHKGYKPYYH